MSSDEKSNKSVFQNFSMPGLLVIVISVGSLFFKRDVITGQLYTQISSSVEKARQVKDTIMTISQTNKSVLATIIGLITVLLGATGVFVELRKAINVIREVKAKPRRALFTIIRIWLFSFGLILSVGFLLLISLTITTIIAVIGNWVMNYWPNIVLIIFYIGQMADKSVGYWFNIGKIIKNEETRR